MKMKRGLELKTNSLERQQTQKVEFRVVCPQTVVNETKTVISKRQDSYGVKKGIPLIISLIMAL